MGSAERLPHEPKHRAGLIAIGAERFERVPHGAGSVTFRRLAPSDSLGDLTDLLHRAYAPLAAAGFRFYASWQDEAATRRRIESGECWVAVVEGRIVGTGTVRPPGVAKGTPWYRRPDVAVVGQFAVEPDLQHRGLGTAILRHLERRARDLGAAHVALDTAEGAARLIAYYEALGYAFVEHVQWEVTNYRSVVLSKRLPNPPHPDARETDP